MKRKWKGQQAAWNEEELGKRLRGVSKSLARENAEKGSLEEEEKDRLENEALEGFFWALGSKRELGGGREGGISTGFG